MLEKSLQQNWKRRSHQSPKVGRCNLEIDGRPSSERSPFAAHTNTCFENTCDRGNGITMPNGARVGRPSEPIGQSAGSRTYAEDRRAEGTCALRYLECRGPTDGTFLKWHGFGADAQTVRQKTEGRWETVPSAFVDMIRAPGPLRGAGE